VNASGNRGVYTYAMTKGLLASVFFLGSLACGSAFADAPADSKPNPDAALPKCRAVDKADATKVLAEAEDKLTTKCSRLLEAKIKAGACTEAANKGKTLQLVTQFDHMIGKAKMKDGTLSVACPK
jgi:hypothetical protein